MHDIVTEERLDDREEYAFRAGAVFAGGLIRGSCWASSARRDADLGRIDATEAELLHALQVPPRTDTICIHTVWTMPS